MPSLVKSSVAPAYLLACLILGGSAQGIWQNTLLQLAGLGSIGVVFGSALPGMARAAGQDDFYFVQLSDTHWGFEGPPNPDAKGTLRKAVASVNGLSEQPDFIVFTGDLTHTTDNPVERRRRMAEFKDIVGGLRVRNLRFMPGEHDASLDNGVLKVTVLKSKAPGRRRIELK